MTDLDLGLTAVLPSGLLSQLENCKAEEGIPSNFSGLMSSEV